MSLHLGLLVHFIFQGAVEDQTVLAGGIDNAPALNRVRNFLSRAHAITLHSSKDREMAHIIRLFTNYQLKKEHTRKRITNSYSSSRGTLPLPSTSVSSHFARSSPHGVNTSSNINSSYNIGTVPLTVAASLPSNAGASFASSYTPSSAYPASIAAPHHSSPIAAPTTRPFADVASSLPSNFDMSLSSTAPSSSYAALNGAIGPSTSSPSVAYGQPITRDDESGSPIESSFFEVMVEQSGPAPVSPSTPKPSPQFTLATTDIPELDPDLDQLRSPDAKNAEVSTLEFNKSTYHSLIGQFLTPLVEADSKVYDLYTDVDMSEFDDQLEATTGITDFQNFSDAVSHVINSLPEFDLVNPDLASSSLAALNQAVLTMESAYIKVVNRGNSKAPPSSSVAALIASMPSSSPENEAEAFFSSLDQEMILKKYRQRYFKAEWNFVATLTGISSLLKHMAFKTKDQKTKALRICLQEFNAEFARGVYMPILRRKGKTYRVIRIPYKEAFTLNSRDRVPYMVFIEAESGDENEEIPDLQTKAVTKTDTLLDDRDEKSAQQPTDAPIVSIRDSEDQKVTRTLAKVEIIDEWVVVDKSQMPDPPGLVERIYKESWAKKCERIRKSSPVGHRKNWELISVVMKSGDDLRQEQLATQLIRCFADIFTKSGLSLWVYPYEVLAVSSQGGFIETIPDALSIHTIKEELGADPSLRNYFQQAYGPRGPAELKRATLNFVESLAAYSLICYILQIKDRHNGNIMLDTEGHLIHIDYGFMLTSSPGSLGFENAPFKLTIEFLEVMGGRNSDAYRYFKTLFASGFLVIRRHYQSIISIVQMMEAGSKMACFSKGPATMTMLLDRFKIGLSDEEAIGYAEELINYSEGNWRTDSYDQYQALTNGIKV